MEQRHLSLIALLATGALLAGCSGGADPRDGGTSSDSDTSSTTQTFTFGGALGPVESIHVEFPELLLDSMGSDADNLLVTSLDLKAHALDSAKYCAVDVTRTFSKGAEPEETRPIGELKEDSPEPGTYINGDGTVVTHVMKCALEPFADSTSETGVEKLGITKNGSPEDFAYVRFTVMKDGRITITDSKIYGYQQDSSGNWLQK